MSLLVGETVELTVVELKKRMEEAEEKQEEAEGDAEKKPKIIMRAVNVTAPGGGHVQGDKVNTVLSYIYQPFYYHILMRRRNGIVIITFY